MGVDGIHHRHHGGGGGFETGLWMLLAILLWSKQKSATSTLTIGHLLFRALVRWPPPPPRQSRSSCWRHNSKKQQMGIIKGGGDIDGVGLSIALVPILLQSMGQTEYAFLVAVSVPSFWVSSQMEFVQVYVWACSITAFLQYALSGNIVVFSKQQHQAGDFQIVDLVSLKSGFFLACWWLTYEWVRTCRPALSKVVTKGEWITVSSLVAVTATEFANVSAVPENAIFAYTALAGLAGISVACGLVDLIISKENVAFRLLFVVVTALGVVEVCFWYQHLDAYPFPRCLWWIFAGFLMQVEQGRSSSNEAAHLPRMAWLAYWFATMLVTIPLAPSSNDGSTGAILARKWFHLVAVLLFVPATLVVPQLQSLSYAVALALLILLESTRHYVPWLNNFYKTYLDSSKDETDDSAIISHMALIAGCASPLWLVQWWQQSQIDTAVAVKAEVADTIQLVSLWGVWVLGVGDAMGAVVGKKYGRLQWGEQHRTVEGSIAMLLSLGVVLMASSGHASIFEWLPAVLFTTMLEAFTLQIDNLVLPLAGVAVIFLCQWGI